jgi:hypothetical protein
MVEWSGIESLTIQRDRPYDLSLEGPNLGNVLMEYTANCWMKNVWSERGVRYHVNLRNAYRNEIRDSVFNDAVASGDGGEGYGVSVSNQATGNLIENNILIRLRHALIIQVGSSGNVFGYNYVRDPFRDQDPDNPTNDISIHGHYPTMNLFEGNIVQRGAIDNVWGTNGYQTIFRNRFEKLPEAYPSAQANGLTQVSHPFFSISSNQASQNIIGNEFGISGSYSTSGDPLSSSAPNSGSHLIHGNYFVEGNVVEWDLTITDHSLPQSLYLDSKPAFFGDIEFPPIGADIPGQYLNPAKQRYLDGGYIGLPALDKPHGLRIENQN